MGVLAQAVPPTVESEGETGMRYELDKVIESSTPSFRGQLGELTDAPFAIEHGSVRLSDIFAVILQRFGNCNRPCRIQNFACQRRPNRTSASKSVSRMSRKEENQCHGQQTVKRAAIMISLFFCIGLEH